MVDYERQLDLASRSALVAEGAIAALFGIEARDGVEAAFMSPALDEFLTASEDFLFAISELHWMQVAAQRASGNGRH